MPREEHSSKGVRVSTGGVKEFVYSKEDMDRIRSTDTKATKDFKKAYYKHKFFIKDYDHEELESIKKYVPFHELEIEVFNKKQERIRKYLLRLEFYDLKGNYSPLISEKCRNTFITELPENKYRIIISKKRFIFFKKATFLEITLGKSVKKEIIL
ncbi:hypothetical protein AYK26_02870 [Euryarchaeota archaeon SM23-78]|nr:MAG: hypothetical protein AYK26_02870 [Euryarchaeota archaeon SM23-78]MBW3001363.1 hypothetical protein [Candidatus Woesearchaeota archaeon]